MYFENSWIAWTTPRPSHRPMEPPTLIDLDNSVFKNMKYVKLTLSTSESMLLIVGLTKSVMVTVTSGTRKIFTLKESSVLSSTLDKNLLLVWKVLQGVAQGDFCSPAKTLIQFSPDN